jgi:hypothetical protein
MDIPTKYVTPARPVTLTFCMIYKESEIYFSRSGERFETIDFKGRTGIGPKEIAAGEVEGVSYRLEREQSGFPVETEKATDIITIDSRAPLPLVVHYEYAGQDAGMRGLTERYHCSPGFSDGCMIEVRLEEGKEQ